MGGSEPLARNDLLSSEIIFSAVGFRVHDVGISSIRIGGGKVLLGAALTLKTGLSFTKALPIAIRPNA